MSIKTNDVMDMDWWHCNTHLVKELKYLLRTRSYDKVIATIKYYAPGVLNYWRSDVRYRRLLDFLHVVAETHNVGIFKVARDVGLRYVPERVELLK